jgi:hypothetical protein
MKLIRDGMAALVLLAALCAHAERTPRCRSPEFHSMTIAVERACRVATSPRTKCDELLRAVLVRLKRAPIHSPPRAILHRDRLVGSGTNLGATATHREWVFVSLVGGDIP